MSEIKLSETNLTASRDLKFTSVHIGDEAGFANCPECSAAFDGNGDPYVPGHSVTEEIKGEDGTVITVIRHI